MINLTKCKLIIHTAALTDVEFCEKFPDEAERINVNITNNITRACMTLNVTLVHISTDMLFSGKKSFSTENDSPSSLNMYARTKYLAEEAVKNSCCKSLIVRTNFYGWGASYTKSFSDFIISNLKVKRKITLFDNVFCMPILIDTLVEIVHKLIKVNAIGVYNIVGNDRISKYDFGLKVAKVFSLDPACILRGTLLDRKDLVARPLDMSLSNLRVNELLVSCTQGIDSDLNRLRENEVSKLAL